jgi:hypothetical protein
LAEIKALVAGQPSSGYRRIGDGEQGRSPVDVEGSSG